MRETTRQAVLERDNYTCRYCATRPDPLETQLRNRWVSFIHVDHIVPLCQGGTNDASNLAAACRDCNLRKGRKFWIPLDWDT